MQVRPTSDRLRETLFNVLAQRIDEETRFLDLCAGSGAIGIEALSRGVAHVTFVDRSHKMCGLVVSNLDLCGVPEDQTEVQMAEAGEFLRRTATRDGQGWDIIFFDPPYDIDYTPVMHVLGSPESKLLLDGGVFIAEHHHKKDLKDEYDSLRRWRILKQGDSALSFYERE